MEEELRPASGAPAPPPPLPKPKLRVERCLPPPLRPLRDSGVPTPPPVTLPPPSAPSAVLSLLPSRRCRRRRIGVIAPVATRLAALEMADMDPWNDMDRRKWDGLGTPWSILLNPFLNPPAVAGSPPPAPRAPPAPVGSGPPSLSPAPTTLLRYERSGVANERISFPPWRGVINAGASEGGGGGDNEGAGAVLPGTKVGGGGGGGGGEGGGARAPFGWVGSVSRGAK